MQVFFKEFYSHIDKNSGRKVEDMFLVKIANKGTSLNPEPTSVTIQFFQNLTQYIIMHL